LSDLKRFSWLDNVLLFDGSHVNYCRQ